MAFEYLFSNEQYKQAHLKDSKSFKTYMNPDYTSRFFQNKYKNEMNWNTFNMSETDNFKPHCKPEFRKSFFQIRKDHPGTSFLEKENPELAKAMIQKMDSDEGFQNYLSSWTRYHFTTNEKELTINRMNALKQKNAIIANDIANYENGTSIVKFHRNWFQQKYAWSRFSENKYINTLRNNLTKGQESLMLNQNYLVRMEKDIKRDSDYITKYEKDNKSFFNRLEDSYKQFVLKVTPPLKVRIVNDRIPSWDVPGFNEKLTQKQEIFKAVNEISSASAANYKQNSTNLQQQKNNTIEVVTLKMGGIK